MLYPQACILLVQGPKPLPKEETYGLCSLFAVPIALQFKRLEIWLKTVVNALTGLGRVVDTSWQSA